MTPQASWFDVALVYYFLLLNGGYLILSFVAFREIYRHLVRSHYGGYEQMSRSPLTPPISVLVPAHNEAVEIATTVNNLLHLDYMRYEVIVVNDGSKDDTLGELVRAFKLVPAERDAAGALPTKRVLGVYRSLTNHNLLVIDKENGGKADALNAALNYAVNPYFCSIDADVILEADALQRVVMPILESDQRVIAVGGIIRVSNGCAVDKGRIVDIDLSANPLVMFQVIEYYRAFLCGRTGFSRFNALMIISGAFGVFERELVTAIGGYRVATVGEDMELVTRLHAHMREKGDADYAIKFVPDPVCWTEAPSTLRVLTSQRRRWHRGLLETLSTYRRMAFNPRFGWLGMLAYPFLWLFEGWGVLVELIGYGLFIWQWSTGRMQTDFAIAFLMAAFVCGTVLSLCGVLLGQMTPRRYPHAVHWLALGAYAVLENVGYRQLSAFMRLWGTLDYLRGAGGWGDMTRSGLRQRGPVA